MGKRFKKLNQRLFAKISLIGLLLLSLLCSAKGAIEGAISNANYLIGVKYRSFANTPDPETILGLTPLAETNPTTGNFNWRKDVKNYFKFTYDPRKFDQATQSYKKVLTTVIFQVNPSPQPTPTIVSGSFEYTISAEPEELYSLSMMKITFFVGILRQKVALQNVKLNGTHLIPYDDFIVAYPSPQKD
jgi:hypothetical protein